MLKRKQEYIKKIFASHLYWQQVTKENAKANVKSGCQMGQRVIEVKSGNGLNAV